MLRSLAYLHGSELVARFQRRCGLFLVDAARHQRPDQNPNHCEGKENRGAVGAGSGPRYQVTNWPLHFLFLVSAGLGHELFYITCLPSIHWSLDPFLCRRLVNMWTLVMYVGQVTKDVLKLPRPLSPPVVKLETRVDAEYGLPSTHAMAATAISFTVLLSAPSRLQFQFEVGLLIALTLSSLVCLSRLYTGMHSVLDVLCGALLSALILALTFPYWEAFDRLQLTSGASPVAALLLPLLLGYTYPRVERYSTTRGDTATILGAGAGCSVGYWANERLGLTFEPRGPLPAPLPALTPGALARGAARFLVGVAALLATRQAAKASSLRALYAWYGVRGGDRATGAAAARRREIEVPYKFFTYTAVGLVNAVLVNRVFVLLGLL
ncbi:sphingosine-1-phosphate phosphatase 2 isoform X2 [Pungitius pungitius]|uniref:sphingosine-1-phosphate phosphatase 2 isoform X2 n=1 Tax=Pungitius pungitius TaxID=134920 RepID=UPI002E0D3C13